ncbi:MAG TPA: hypothetical protein VH163_04715 [Gemmatimonadales bacterium]|nr:hypothetical protein [Gemmatimonadales bacterium]
MRAIWITPAGLAVRQEASVYLDLTITNPGSLGQLRQLNAGFNARGLAFAYQRDQFSGGTRAGTYKLAFSTGQGSMAVGFGTTWYRGDTKGTGFDLVVTYKAVGPLAAAVVIANIGQPRVQGLVQRVRYTGSASLQVAPGFALGALAAANPSGFQVFGADLRAQFEPGFPLGVIFRMDTDQKFRRTQFALGISIGGLNQIGVVTTTPGDVSSVNAVTLYGLSAKLPSARH